jgi:hypothetical protein
MRAELRRTHRGNMLEQNEVHPTIPATEHIVFFLEPEIVRHEEVRPAAGRPFEPVGLQLTDEIALDHTDSGA